MKMNIQLSGEKGSSPSGKLKFRRVCLMVKQRRSTIRETFSKYIELNNLENRWANAAVVAFPVIQNGVKCPG